MTFDSWPIPTESQFPCRTLVACLPPNQMHSPLEPTTRSSRRVVPGTTELCGTTVAWDSPGLSLIPMVFSSTIGSRFPSVGPDPPPRTDQSNK